MKVWGVGQGGGSDAARRSNSASVHRVYIGQQDARFFGVHIGSMEALIGSLYRVYLNTI